MLVVLSILWPHSEKGGVNETVYPLGDTRSVYQGIGRQSLGMELVQGLYERRELEEVKQEAVDDTIIELATAMPVPDVPRTATATPVATRALGFTQLGQQDVVEVICSFPWPCGEAVRVATCESGLNNGAIGRAGERSLFQIHPVHFKRFDPNRLSSDVWYGTNAGYTLWSEQGWRPWSCKP